MNVVVYVSSSFKKCNHLSNENMREIKKKKEDEHQQIFQTVVYSGVTVSYNVKFLRLALPPHNFDI